MALIGTGSTGIQIVPELGKYAGHLSVFQRPFANTWLNIAVVWELVLLLAILYVPFLQRAFATYALSLEDWIITAAMAFTVVPVLELVKWMTRHMWFGEVA